MSKFSIVYSMYIVLNNYMFIWLIIVVVAAVVVIKKKLNTLSFITNLLTVWKIKRTDTLFIQQQQPIWSMHNILKDGLLNIWKT